MRARLSPPGPRPALLRIRLGAALPALAAALALGAAVVAAFTLAPSAKRPAVSSVRLVDPLTTFEVATTLSAAGLDAQSLAAAGLSGPEATSLLSRARSHLQEHIQTLRDADSARAASQASYDALRRRVESGLASEADLSNLATAASALGSAQASRQSALDALSSDATSQLDPAKVIRLATLRGNHGWEVPIQYRAANRSQPDWVALRDALANDRIAARRGEDPDPAAHQLLLDAQANANVSAAASSLQNLPDLQAAWNQGVVP
jgi:hypothetical protein